MKWIIILLMSFGCGMTNDEAKERFGDRQAMVCIDEFDGSRWVISHHLGNTFTVEPVRGH